MDKAERKRLKKLGKAIVEKQSQEVRAALSEANPAAIGTPEWVANFKAQSEERRRLRKSSPDFIPPDDARRDWVTLSCEQLHGPEFWCVPTWYYHCARCGSLLHSCAEFQAWCSCGNVSIDPDTRVITIKDRGTVTLKRLVPKGPSFT